MIATILSVWCPTNCPFQYVLKSAHSPASHLFTFPLTSTSILFISHSPYSILNFHFSIFTSHPLTFSFPTSLLPHSLTPFLPHSLPPFLPSLLPPLPIPPPVSLTSPSQLLLPYFPHPPPPYLSRLPTSPTSRSTYSYALPTAAQKHPAVAASQPNQLHKKTFPGPTSGRTLNYIS